MMNVRVIAVFHLCLFFLFRTVNPEVVRTFHYNNQRTGRTDNCGTGNPPLLWSFSTGASIEATPLVGLDGSIFIASTNGRVYSLTAKGRLRWSFTAQESIFATPALSDDGILYVADIQGNLYLIRSQDGSLVRKVEIPGLGEKRILTSLAIDDLDRAYIGSWNNKYYSVNSAGSVLWGETLAGLPSAPVALDEEGYAYLAALDPWAYWPETFQLAVVKKAPGYGQSIWRYSKSLVDERWPNDQWLRRNRITASPVIDSRKNRVYIAVSKTSDGLLLGLSLADAEEELQVTFPKGIIGTPALGENGLIYIPCLDGMLYALNTENSQIDWSFQAASPYLMSSPTVDGFGQIYFGDSDGILYALSPNGEELWRYETGSNILSAPVIAEDGKILVTSYDGKLHVLGSPEIFYFSQIGNGFSGSLGLKTRIEFLNTGPDSELLIDIFDSDGSPMSLHFQSMGKSNQFKIPLARGEVFSDTTDGLGDLKVGFIRITGPQTIGGLAVFIYSIDGTILSEAGVPAASGMSDATIFVQSRNEENTGFALVNTEEEAAEITFRLYDPLFQLIATRSISEIIGTRLKAHHHLARYAAELFPELSKLGLERGILTIESEKKLAMITVRMDQSISDANDRRMVTLTTYPVMANRADTIEETTHTGQLFFPQIAQGSNPPLLFNTDLFLASLQGGGSIDIQFHNHAGEALAVPLIGRGAVSKVSIEISNGQSVLESTVGSGSLISGSASVSASNSIGGTALFKAEEDGVKLFEAGVPDGAPSTDFSMIVRSTNKQETGIALMNTGTERADITFRLYDRSFQFLAAASIEEILGSGLSVHGHFAQYLREIFPAYAGKIDLGLLTVESSQRLAAVSLNESDDPENSYPEDIYRITVYPVVEGRPDE